ncbi:formylglycine-generating enzyme family protein [Methanolobus sp. ZRKC2]|uniref:formylglycine-generating enzyme family protein n=1 Tax=Methanolobus sp. ZRKC2 TaxID=3125783 RepID=UPI00325351C4
MSKKAMIVLLICALLTVTVLSSGCTDSGENTEIEQNTDSTDLLAEAEDTVDDSVFTNSIGMEFVKIPAGEFIMGSPENESYRDGDEGPQHLVTVSNEFYLGAYEVTQAQWKEIMDSEPFYFEGDDLAAEKISWNNAIKFIEELNRIEETHKYRLPTEAEWEYAARAGTTTAFSFGDDTAELTNYAWYDANSEDKIHSVGLKEPNSWGLYDMHGNVAEWVQDEYHSNYFKAPTDSSEWTGGVDRRVFRGGSWMSDDVNCRSADRNDISPGSRKEYIGFRVVKEV